MWLTLAFVVNPERWCSHSQRSALVITSYESVLLGFPKLQRFSTMLKKNPKRKPF